MQMFNHNLGGVIRIFNLNNDFGSLHKNVYFTTWIPTTYPRMMFLLVWNGVIPNITTSILGARLGYTLTTNGQPITQVLTQHAIFKFKGSNPPMLAWTILVPRSVTLIKVKRHHLRKQLPYPPYVKDINVHVRVFKVTIQMNGETKDGDIVNMFYSFYKIQSHNGVKISLQNIPTTFF